MRVVGSSNVNKVYSSDASSAVAVASARSSVPSRSTARSMNGPWIEASPPPTSRKPLTEQEFIDRFIRVLKAKDCQIKFCDPHKEFPHLKEYKFTMLASSQSQGVILPPVRLTLKSKTDGMIRTGDLRLAGLRVDQEVSEPVEILLGNSFEDGTASGDDEATTDPRAAEINQIFNLGLLLKGHKLADFLVTESYQSRIRKLENNLASMPTNGTLEFGTAFYPFSRRNRIRLPVVYRSSTESGSQELHFKLDIRRKDHKELQQNKPQKPDDIVIDTITFDSPHSEDLGDNVQINVLPKHFPSGINTTRAADINQRLEVYLPQIFAQVVKAIQM